MIKQALLALAITGAMATAQATVVLNEGFANVDKLAAQGWIRSNLSNPVGDASAAWFQPTTGFFAQNAADHSYLASTFNNAAAGGTLDTWLITPAFSAVFGAVVSFWMQAGAFAGTSDTVSYGFIDAAGVFTSAASNMTVATGEWTQYFANIGNTAGTTRFAIHYTGAADTSNFVGVDTLLVDVPEPASLLIMAAGLIGLTAARRRKHG